MTSLSLIITTTAKERLYKFNKGNTSTELNKKTVAGRQSGWLLYKSLQAINAGEGVEKREPSYTVGGNAD